ncbi:FG-GAP-like repeat-containing protein, partial [Ciceribacter sp. RN22]|uniref:FG-GAP-like repeat-containing protein n=1 Tax=Ciceribacter sp. RN22 TaxID=2954932 RepID=UPI0020932726
GGTGANSLTVDQQTVLDMSGTTDTLVIVGGTDDSVTATGFTPTGTTATLNGMTFNVYTNGPATVWIQQGVQVNGIATPVIAIDTPIAGDDIVNLAESTGVTITGTTTGVEAGQTVTVTLTDGTNTVTTTATVLPDGTWQAAPADLSTLTDGPVDVAANVTNAGGTSATDTAPAALDTTPPLATIEAMSNDSATYGDFISSADTTQMSGTTDPGATVTISAGGTVIGTVTADATGTWISSSIDLSGLATGATLTVSAEVTDAAGNVTTVTQDITGADPAPAGFSPEQQIGVAGGGDDPSGAWKTVIGDVNGDGFADLVTLDSNPAVQDRVAFGNGDGTFAPEQYIGEAGGGDDPTGAWKTVMGDVNGDGIADLVILDSNPAAQDRVAFG